MRTNYVRGTTLSTVLISLMKGQVTSLRSGETTSQTRTSPTAYAWMDHSIRRAPEHFYGSSATGYTDYPTLSKIN